MVCKNTFGLETLRWINEFLIETFFSSKNLGYKNFKNVIFLIKSSKPKIVTFGLLKNVSGDGDIWI